MSRHLSFVGIAIVGGTLVLGACGGGSSSDATSSTTRPAHTTRSTASATEIRTDRFGCRAMCPDRRGPHRNPTARSERHRVRLHDRRGIPGRAPRCTSSMRAAGWTVHGGGGGGWGGYGGGGLGATKGAANVQVRPGPTRARPTSTSAAGPVRSRTTAVVTRTATATTTTTRTSRATTRTSRTTTRTRTRTADPQPALVEVTVGRLRRKLGAAGALVVTVPRRGYRLSAELSAG